MPELTAAEVARACAGRLRGEQAARVSGFVADSRSVRPGIAFVAVNTGHDHVAAALEAGAPLAVVEREDALPAGTTGVVVPAIEPALAALASAWRERLDVRVVGITGSTGKTLTKDLTAAALGASFRVHATPASYNNEVGLPLTVLGCPDDAEVIVAEMGARHPGEIADLCRIVRPGVGVITGIGVAHLGEFGSRGAIARTKSELVMSLPANGTAVLPAGDDFLALLAGSTTARTVTVGHGGRVRARAVTLDDHGCPHALVETADGRTVELHVPVPGRALIRNGCLALAAAGALGADLEAAARAIAEAPTSPRRMQVVKAGSRTIVNDAYNANPTSVASALRTVAEVAAGRPAWAILGPMAELGPIAGREHRRVGRLAASLGFDSVIAVGDEASLIAQGAGSVGRRVAGMDEAAAAAESAPSDAVLLVKGSRVAGMERLASMLESG